MKAAQKRMIDELSRTAAVIAERDDVYAVTIDLYADENGNETSIFAWRCENPECGTIHVDVDTRWQSRMRLDEETRELHPIPVDAEGHDE